MGDSASQSAGPVIHTEVVSELPVVSVGRRSELAALATKPGRAGVEQRAFHDELLTELPFARTLEVREPIAPVALRQTARIVAWNLERGAFPDASAALLAGSGADVMLLSELDRGMARSGQCHTTRSLADGLECGYAYAVEFLELGLGSGREREQHAGEHNDVGYHGGALLSRAPLARPAFVRLGDSGAWFGSERGEARIGARIAVLATVSLGGCDVVVASLHLESNGTRAGREEQIAAVIAAIDRYAPGAPALIGGDMNTFSLDLAEWGDRAVAKAALRSDPGRLVNPVPYEPLFETAARHGFTWETCNVPREPTQRVGSSSDSSRGGLKIDWFLSRGLATSEPEVLAAVDPDTGDAVSDHEPIAVTIAPA